MTFQPVVPSGGLGGWSFLERTRVRQEEAFARAPANARLAEDFRNRIAGVRSAEALVADRRLLTVALGAFGLGDDIGNRFFIRKVLEEGTRSPEALANRLTDKRYLALAEAFGFGDRPGGNVGRPGFADTILRSFQSRQFEIAVGRSNGDMRLALGLAREIQTVVDRQRSDDGRWFAMMGTPPLRTVFERALGLPSSVGTLDVDRQLALFKDRAAARLGTSDFGSIASADGQRTLLRSFLAASTSATPASAGALTLLGAGIAR